MAICSNCGKNMDDGAMFCSGCGQKMVVAPPTEPAASVDSILAESSGVVAPDMAQITEIEDPNGKKEGRKKNKKILFIACVAGLIVLGVVLFLIFHKNDAQKIASAFNKTLTSESFACEGYVKYGSETFNFNGEIYGDKKTNLFYLMMDEEERGYYGDKSLIAFANGVFYEGYYYNYYYYEDAGEWRYYKSDDKDIIGMLDKICQRDFFGAAKYNDDVEADIKEMCKNYEDVPEILMTMLEDIMKSGDELSFIKSVKKKDKSYTLVIDSDKFVKAAKKDYGVQLDTELYDEIMDELEYEGIGDVELTIMIEKGYISSLYAEVEVGRKTAEAYVEFSSYNDVKANKSEAFDIAEKAEKYIRDRREYDDY